ncbi:Bacterial PH domain protein [uncultured archaeon]|nr:Bacterial PH domain protein [uncultured archaeon]
MSFFTGKEIKVPDDISKILQPEEQVLLASQQARSTNLINPDTIFITTKRLMIRKPTSLGLRKNIEDYRFADIANVKLHKGIVRSSILLKVRFLSDDLEIDNISKEAGDKIVQLIQQGIAGDLDSPRPHTKTSSVLQQDILDEIKKLANLKDQGILSDDEFKTKKAELLERL